MYYEVKVKVNAINEKGNEVVESFVMLINAVSFSDAEYKAMEQEPEAQITAIKKSKIESIVVSPKGEPKQNVFASDGVLELNAFVVNYEIDPIEGKPLKCCDLVDACDCESASAFVKSDCEQKGYNIEIKSVKMSNIKIILDDNN